MEDKQTPEYLSDRAGSLFRLISADPTVSLPASTPLPVSGHLMVKAFKALSPFNLLPVWDEGVGAARVLMSKLDPSQRLPGATRAFEVSLMFYTWEFILVSSLVIKRQFTTNVV